jgi:hypothetical protein
MRDKWFVPFTWVEKRAFPAVGAIDYVARRSGETNIAVGGRGRPFFFGCAGDDPKSQENPVVGQMLQCTTFGLNYCAAQHT